MAGAGEEAVAASEGLLAAESTDNPGVASWALFAYGSAHRDADPVAAYEALRRGLRIAQDNGDRQLQSNLAVSLSGLAATDGEPMDALDSLTLAIRNYLDAGSLSLMPFPLAILAVVFDRLGHYEPAAIISGVAATPLTRAAYPEINSAITHLREVLGDEAYESFARAGVNMTNAAMAAYALDQIDRARADLMRAGTRD